MQAVGSYYWFYSWGHQKLRNQVPISDSEKVGTMSGQFKISKVCTSRSVQSDHSGSSMTNIKQELISNNI